MKDNANGLELNDSMAIVQYLVSQYPGPLTPENNEIAARVNMIGLGYKTIIHLYCHPFTTLLLKTTMFFGGTYD